MLHQHWPSVPNLGDIRTIHLTPGVFDVLTGGFPCQDISTAGKGAGLDGTRSSLWWEYHRLIKEGQPRFVIIENSPALRARGLDRVLRSLSEIGYDAVWNCLPAALVGAPHRRDRTWVVAYRRDLFPGFGPNFQAALQRLLVGHDPQADSVGPNSAVQRLRETGQLRREQPEERISRVGEEVAHPDHPRLEVLQSLEVEEQQPAFVGASAWAAEPDVGRVAYGVPSRVDRIKALGNAVVPQLPYLIGLAILAAV